MVDEITEEDLETARGLFETASKLEKSQRVFTKKTAAIGKLVEAKKKADAEHKEKLRKASKEKGLAHIGVAEARQAQLKLREMFVDWKLVLDLERAEANVRSIEARIRTYRQAEDEWRLQIEQARKLSIHPDERALMVKELTHSRTAAESETNKIRAELKEAKSEARRVETSIGDSIEAIHKLAFPPKEAKNA